MSQLDKIRPFDSVQGQISSRIPPQSLEAETAILASVLMDNYLLNQCLEFIRPDDFYKEAHKKIFQAMIDLNEKNEPCDLVTLNNYLKDKNLIEQVGGASYLSMLVDSVPSAANVTSYAKLVREKSLIRNLIRHSTDIISECYNSENVDDLIDKAENRIFSVSENKVKSGFAQVKDLVKESYKHVENLFENRGQLSGLPTGFTDLDKFTNGLQKGDLFIIAGRPSMGKTAFVLNLAENAAQKSDGKIAIFSLEMGKEQLVLRMLTSQARIDATAIRKGELNESDWPRILEACDTLGHMNIFIDDQPAQSTLEIRAKARRLAKEHGLDLIIIDYLQLMRGSGMEQSREQEISAISRSLKALAKELNIPVIALSQLNRSLEARKDKRPMMSDLRESGAIEQDADIICFVYRDEVYDPNSIDKGIAEIIIGKHRNGPIGTVRLAFLNKYTKFEDLVFDNHDYQEYEPVE